MYWRPLPSLGYDGFPQLDMKWKRSEHVCVASQIHSFTCSEEFSKGFQLWTWIT
jgi:hypothetical protein